MSCNLQYSENNKLTGVVADNQQPSLLYKEATKKFGKEMGLDIYLASKSDDFQDNIILSQNQLDENNEPKLNIVLNYLSLQNESKEPLTIQQKLDLKNISLGVENFSVQKLVDAFYSDGIFNISPKKLKKSGLYSDYEIANLANDVNLQEKVKQSLEALKNTEDFEVDVEFTEDLEKTGEVNSFGKLTNINPYLVQKEVLEKLVGTTEEQFEANLAELEYPNLQKKLEKPIKKSLIEKVIEQLRKNKLANNIYIYTNAQIEQKLRELGYDVNKQVDAYHGSPYSFDRFTTEKMGTGEGAQAFGWGLYFTDTEDIAKHYATTLQKGTPKIINILNTWGVDTSSLDSLKSELSEVSVINEKNKNELEGLLSGKQIKIEEFKEEEVNRINSMITFFGKPISEELRSSFLLRVNQTVESKYSQRVEQLKNSIKNLSSEVEQIEEAISTYDIWKDYKKNLYKVSLHKGKEVGEYTWLEWDKEMPKNLLDEIGKNVLDKTLAINNTGVFQFKKDGVFYKGERNSNGDWSFIDRNTNKKIEYSEVANTWQELYNEEVLNKKGLKFYKRLENFLESDKNASLFLLESGIDGIKYPAESISRGATSDTARGFNYVVFDENAITIEEQIQFQKADENLVDEYLKRITAVKQANPQDYWSVDIPSREVVENSTIVKNDGGMALVTQDGNLIGLFKDKNVKGVAKDLQEQRVALGGIKLDNYDGYLTKLYQKNGFRVVSRTAFDEIYAQEGWNKELHGTPDVVAMIYDPQNKLNIEEKRFATYNEAIAYRDSFVNEARTLNPTKIQFQRVADQLPLTLQVFERPEFVKLQGKQVNPITVLNSLNQSGIKQIERDLIKQVIYDNYKGQNKVDYDELEATVRANIMPLERITTSSYADYGMDNLGSGNYGEAKTLIFNAPIEHGVTGHFSGDFKASGRQNIKYQAKQLNDNTWVAVEEGYESQANDNNIYQYVGTAGTKEAVDAWINNYNGGREVLSVSDDTIEYNIIYPTGFDPEVQITRNISVDLGRGNDYLGSAEIEYDENLSEQEIKKQAVDKVNQKNKNRFTSNYESNINKGMFGHIRVWQDGEVFTVAELQSDTYQKNKAKELFIKQSNINKKAKENVKDKFFSKFNFTKIDKRNRSEYAYEYNGQTLFIRESDGEFDPYIDDRGLVGDYKTLEEAKNEIKQNLDFFSDENFTKELEKEKIKVEQEFLKNLSPQEKQFIASQKIWEQRMVREAIKEASLSGATSLRFPTPYTLSVIEGYISEEGNLPYEVESAEDEESLEVGDTINYAGSTYTVIKSDSSSIEVAQSENVYSVNIDSFINEEITYRTNETMDNELEVDIEKMWTQEEWDAESKFAPLEDIQLEDIGNEIEEGFYEISESKVREIIEEFHSNYYNSGNIYSILDDMGYDNITEVGDTAYYTEYRTSTETFGQPDTYDRSSKEDFSIEDDLDDTQQTVARKYEEIAEILKKEKTVEVVTDENGFDWYEAKITQEDTQKPVIAFQKNPKDVTMTTSGFVHKGDVYLNKDRMKLDTPVHELGHLYLNYLKSNNSDIYERGLQLAQSEDAKEYVDYVERTQPQLTGEAKLNEILAQAIGDNGAKLADKSWIGELWDEIKKLFGLSEYTNEQVQNMTLKQFTQAISVDLYKNQLFQEMQGYKKAEVFMEVDGKIVQAKNTNTAVVLPLVAKQIDKIEDINKLQQYDLEVLQANQEDTAKILKGIETKLIGEGIDVAGLADKEINAELISFLGELEVFINNPTAENTQAFADVYDVYFEKDLSPKKEIVKREETDRDFVKLTTNLSEEEVYEQQGLIKVKDGLYIRTNKQDLETLYASLETYKKHPKNTTLKEYVQNQISKLEYFKNSDNAEAVYLYKMYFDLVKDGNYMLAPNGKPTNLTEEQWLQVRTPEFKAWFGDFINDPKNASKVVDKNGEPMVVYHGTKATFNEFSTDYGAYTDGTFFSTKLGTASIYGDTRAFFIRAYNVKEVGSSLPGVYDMGDIRGTEFDGLWNKGTNEIVVGTANQIKSATENTGAFSTETNDIRFQKTDSINFTGNYEYLTTEFVSDFYIEMLKEREKNSEIYKNFYSNFDVNENGIYLKNDDNITMSQINEYLSNSVDVKLENKEKDLLDEFDDEVIGKKTVKGYELNFKNGSRAFGTIEDSTATITQINAPKQGDTYTVVRGQNTYYNVFNELKKLGVTSVKVRLQSADSRAAIKKMVGKNILINPREYAGISVDEYPTLFDINLEKLTDKPSIFENLKQYSIISKQMPLLAEQEIKSETKQVRRDAILNSPQNLEKYQGQYHKLNDNNLILKNSGEEFIKVGGNIFEAVDTDGNLTLYSRLNTVVGEYNTFNNEAPKTDVKIEDYSYLNTQPEKFLTEKKYLSKSAKEKINRESFDCI